MKESCMLHWCPENNMYLLKDAMKQISKAKPKLLIL